MGKITLALIMSIAIAGCFLVMGLLAVVDVFAPPSFSISLASVQNISAKAWLIFDVETGTILYEQNAQEALPIASITKLPMAKVFSDTQDIWATTTITWADISAEGRAGKLSHNQTYTLHTLLFPLLLESSNDASAVFARVSSELVPDMNSYAQAQGWTHTIFTDTSGLSTGNMATAREVRSMLREVYLYNRHLIDITSLPSYYASDNGWLNNNPFVTDDRYIGGKHGYTPEAGRTSATIFKESLQNGQERTIGYIVLGSDNLAYDMNILRNHTQRFVSLQ